MQGQADRLQNEAKRKEWYFFGLEQNSVKIWP